MNNLIRILTKVGEYIYRNSVWLIPVAETMISQIKKVIRRKKEEHKNGEEDKESSGDGGPQH